jgi:Ca2+-binding RTX toxin-like protein
MKSSSMRRALRVGARIATVSATAVAGTLIATQARAMTPTVSVTSGWLTFIAATGQENQVVVSALGSSSYLVEDRNPVVSGSGCRPAEKPGSAVCSGNIFGVSVQLGDLKDSVTINALFNQIVLDGGPGPDTLVAGPADPSGTWTMLRGGAGDDKLVGGDGIDLLDGGPGADVMSGGGGSDDRVTYSGRTTPITADLDGSEFNDGESGERDTIRADVEGIVGGSTDDHLSANPTRGSSLEGGPGADMLYGGAGDDTISGSEGQDLLFGGPGADMLDGGDDNDWVEGGPGYDHINGGPALDVCLPQQDGGSAACEVVL